MPEPRTQPRRKIVAIMAADVAGYSRLMGRDEEGTYLALRAHLDELFIPQIAEFEGRIIKFIGDGVLAEFPSAVDALNCSAALQAEMAVRNRDVPSDTQLNFRIGLHVGDVMEADGDLFGDGVNTAARVEGTATPGGINVSRFVYESVRKKVPLEFEDLGDHMFKSFEEPVQVYRVHGFLRPRTELRLGEMRERIAPGTRLNGIYEIDSLIAVGSTSEVYRARSVQTDDPVVIKAIAPQLTQSPAAIDNVRSQASALYRLHHDAIARTFLCSVDEAVGQVYLAMEAVDGISLGDRVRHTPLTPDEADILRRRIAGALGEAHAAGVIHRAVTPDNIVLPEGDVSAAKLIDFTIAGLRPESERTVLAPSLDPANLFQAPEQLGHFGGQEGPATDAYGLGQVLAFALTGANLQQFSTFAELVEGRLERPDLGPLPARLRPLVEAMLAPDPAKRLADMDEIGSWDWTRPLKVTRPPMPRETPPDTAPHAAPTPDVRKSKRGLILVAGVAALALAGAGGWYALNQDNLGPTGTSPPGDTSTSPATDAGDTANPAPQTPPSSIASAGDTASSAGGGQTAAASTQSGAPASDGGETITRENPAASTPTPTETPESQTPESETPETDAATAANAGPPVTDGVVSALSSPPEGDGTSEAAPPEPAPATSENLLALQPAPPVADTLTLTTLDGRANMPAAIAEMMADVDQLNGPACFFASVDKASDAGLFVDMYAQDADVIYKAYNSLKAAVGFDPNVTGRLISDPQCAALDFAGLGKSTSLMGLSLKERSLAAGTPLDGTLSNVPATTVLLVAIDPRGIVYDLSKALEPGPGGLRFVLNVNHPARGSITNLLLAVSIPNGATAPPITQGSTAATFLPALAKALDAAGQPAAIRLDHFVLRS